MRAWVRPAKHPANAQADFCFSPQAGLAQRFRPVDPSAPSPLLDACTALDTFASSKRSRLRLSWAERARRRTAAALSVRNDLDRVAALRAVSVSSKDIVYLRGDGGGGYGDPLDRDPSLVHADVAAGIVSIAAAKSEYGVVLDPATDSVDDPATRGQRLALREERLGRKPTAEAKAGQEIARTQFRINEYLQLTSDRGHVECVALWSPAVRQRTPLEGPRGHP